MGIFSCDHLKKLLHNKFVILIGDSVQRSIYKDLLVLWHENRFIKDKELRAKGETSFLGDRLVERSELTNGTEYREVREFKRDHILIRFYFATRIYNDYIESVLNNLEDDKEFTPDVVIINSCLWDISRYGKKGWNEYQKNLEKFCTRLDDIVPPDTCIIWRTTLPVSQSAHGGFLAGNLSRHKESLVVDVLLANYLAYAVIERHKYDVIDMHFMFTQQQQRRAMDGIHWNMFAHRRMTNIVLTHVSQAWGLGVPEHPVMVDMKLEFDPKDISMNTTDVLKTAYNPEPTTTKSSAEQRYGGPMRSRTEMFDYYSRFYRDPLPHNVDLHNDKPAPSFKFDLGPSRLPQPPRRVEAYDEYWTRDDHFPSDPKPPHIDNKMFNINSRKVTLVSGFHDNWKVDSNFHQNQHNKSNWKNCNRFHPKLNQRRKQTYKPYYNRQHGC